MNSKYSQAQVVLPSDLVRMRERQPLRHLSDVPGVTVFGIVHDGLLVAHAEVHRAPKHPEVAEYLAEQRIRNVPEIRSVYVDPNHRGNHLSEAVLEPAIWAINPRVHSHVVLVVAEDNVPAVRAYRTLGFEFVGDGFWSDSARNEGGDLMSKWSRSMVKPLDGEIERFAEVNRLAAGQELPIPGARAGLALAYA